MADDLVAERVLDGAATQPTTTSSTGSRQGGDASTRATVVGGASRRCATFHAALEAAEGILTPTQRQGEVIAERLDDPILLVQGPPGTGQDAHPRLGDPRSRVRRRARRPAVPRARHGDDAHRRRGRPPVDRRQARRSSSRIRRPRRSLRRSSDLRLFKEQSSAGAAARRRRRRSAATICSTASSTTSLSIAAVPSGVHRLLQGVVEADRLGARSTSTCS